MQQNARQNILIGIIGSEPATGVGLRPGAQLAANFQPGGESANGRSTFRRFRDSAVTQCRLRQRQRRRGSNEGQEWDLAATHWIPGNSENETSLLNGPPM